MSFLHRPPAPERMRQRDSGLYVPDDTSGPSTNVDTDERPTSNRRMLRAAARSNPTARQLRRQMKRVRTRGLPERMAVPKKRRH